MCQGETRSLLSHLFQFTESHRAEGLELQRDVAEFESELQTAVDEIWARPPPAEDEETTPDGWAARMAEVERRKATNPIDTVPKPGTSMPTDWRVSLLGL